MLFGLTLSLVRGAHVRGRSCGTGCQRRVPRPNQGRAVQAYLVIGKCHLHVVVIAVVEHLDGVVPEGRDAVGPHRPGPVKPCEEQQGDAEAGC